MQQDDDFTITLVRQRATSRSTPRTHGGLIDLGRAAQRLSGCKVNVVHVVGGGVHNELLCQLTADACGLPVEAGPVEAGALGNVLVQARALGRSDRT